MDTGIKEAITHTLTDLLYLIKDAELTSKDLSNLLTEWETNEIGDKTKSLYAMFKLGVCRKEYVKIYHFDKLMKAFNEAAEDVRVLK